MFFLVFSAARPYGEQAERESVEAARLPREKAAAGGEHPAPAAAAPRHEEHPGEIRQEHDGTANTPLPLRSPSFCLTHFGRVCDLNNNLYYS